MDLVLNAAGPFLHTAAPLAKACLSAGVHYLDISNELQVFRALYELDEGAKRAGVSIIPGVGFGVVATNCLARYVSEAVGGAEHLEVASRVASAQPGPGAAATMQENLPYGGWIRQGGQLVPKELFTGVTTIGSPTVPARRCPSRREIWRRHSTPQELRASSRTRSALPPAIRRASEPEMTGAPTSAVFRVGSGNRLGRIHRRGVAADGRFLQPSRPRPASAPWRRPLRGSHHGALSPAVSIRC